MITFEWEGEDTAARIKVVLPNTGAIRIVLPAKFHQPIRQQLYAVFDILLDDKVAIQGDAEQLKRLAVISGLHELADIVQSVRSLASKVWVTSPPILSDGIQRG